MWPRPGGSLHRRPRPRGRSGQPSARRRRTLHRDFQAQRHLRRVPEWFLGTVAGPWVQS
ncbi:unnamed protein product [Linum tenue]|uniref:Uncharacterized protein n=1 Tax=Linum tenue TaxID=586396 RepID=A0AAV0MTR6_9ROSI|nr:unnamed protein product [Linum tenue]